MRALQFLAVIYTNVGEGDTVEISLMPDEAPRTLPMPTDGKNKEELEENIRDAVECYFEVPYTEVDIKIKYK